MSYSYIYYIYNYIYIIILLRKSYPDKENPEFSQVSHTALGVQRIALHYYNTSIYLAIYLSHAKTDVIGVIENYQHVQEIDIVMDREISLSSG